MKQATSTFEIDNGIVTEGKLLPEGHPAVVRFPENFRTVQEGDDLQGQAVADFATGEHVEQSGDEGAEVERVEPTPEVESPSPSPRPSPDDISR